jgi:hypothetical protein
MSAEAVPTQTGPGQTGVIHDLGYQRYTGDR